MFFSSNFSQNIDSIFYKVGLEVNDKSKLNINENWSKEEKEIIFQIQKSNEIIKDSTKDYASQALTENLIKLCQMFHGYYEGETIIGNAKQSQKLNLLNYIYHNLKENIDILGIEGYSCKQKLMNKNSIKVKM